MRRSFAAGRPESIEAVRTIADSLGAPHAAPYSFELCRRALDDLVLVSDDELRAAMKGSAMKRTGVKGLRRNLAIARENLERGQ
jgi:threonine dehydratase